MKKILFILVALFATSWLWAGNVITYTATEKLPETTSSSASGLHTNAFNTTISSHSFSDGVGTITFSGDLTAIGWGGHTAFRNCSNLTSITIPDGVKYLNECAYKCSALTSIEIPNSVTKINAYAFRGCSALTSIEIPNSVTSIGDYAFYECSALTSIEIPNSVISIGDYAFFGCSCCHILTIGESVSSIGRSAFDQCSALTSIVWHATDCPSFSTSSMDYMTRAQITSFVIGENVTSIPEYLCRSMKKLMSVNIPNGVASIGDDAFSECENLTNISIPSSVESIGSSAFSGCSKLFSFSIPSFVTTIGSNAFYNIPNIVYSGTASGAPWGAKIVNGYMDGYLVYSDNTKTKIMGCSPLATGAIVIPSSVNQINHRAFDGCSGLTEVHISDLEKWCSIDFGVEQTNPLYYAHHLYLNGQEVVNLTIPSTITTIYNSAFCGCYSLETVTIPSSVTRIWSHAFEGCKGLTTVTMANSVTQIAASAFEGCSSMTSVNIPNGVTSIGSAAFQGCTGLTSIDIPSSVTKIDSYAFAQIPNVNYSGSALDYGDNNWGAKTRNGTVDGYIVYTDDSKTTLSACSVAATGDIVIPGTVTNIKSLAFYNCESISSITLPGSLSAIDSYAFQHCTGLTAVHIDDVASWCNIHFGSNDANPLYYAHHLYMGGNEITELEIPDGVSNIPNRAFYGCSNITSVIIPNTVNSIGFYAFADCGLTSVEIPSSVTSIESSVFQGCSNLSSVTWNAIRCTTPTDNYEVFAGVSSQITNFTIGDGVEVIPRILCINMNNLSSVTIPSSVTSIEYYAFAYCSGLETITIPANVVSIGEGAFFHTDLSSLMCEAMTPPIVEDGFALKISSSSWTSNIPVYVPAGCVAAYQNADVWKDMFTNFQEIIPEVTEYTRDVTAGRYGTICLPKSVIADEIEGGVFYNIVYAVTNTQNEVTGILMEEETGDLEAGKAYIYRATADKLVLPYVGDALNDPTTTNGLVGNLSETAVEVPQGMYVLSNNQIRKLNGGTATVGQNKAYIDLTNVKKLNYVPAASPKRVVLNVADGDSVITGVDCIIPNTSTLSTKMLKDGKIIIVNGNRTFDALGNNL